MSLEDFDPSKHGPVAALFAAAAAFVLFLIAKARALFKNGDAVEIKEMLAKLDEKVDGINLRLARIEGARDAWTPERRTVGREAR